MVVGCLQVNKNFMIERRQACCECRKFEIDPKLRVIKQHENVIQYQGCISSPSVIEWHHIFRTLKIRC